MRNKQLLVFERHLTRHESPRSFICSLEILICFSVSEKIFYPVPAAWRAVINVRAQKQAAILLVSFC